MSENPEKHLDILKVWNFLSPPSAPSGSVSSKQMLIKCFYNEESPHLSLLSVTFFFRLSMRNFSDLLVLTDSISIVCTSCAML